MNENSIGEEVVDAAIAVHRELGSGLLETVYEVVLLDELLTYLKLSGMKLGFLLNFSEAMMKDGITRTVNGLH